MMPIICVTRSGFGLCRLQQNRGLRPCLCYTAPFGADCLTDTMNRIPTLFQFLQNLTHLRFQLVYLLLLALDDCLLLLHCLDEYRGEF